MGEPKPLKGRLGQNERLSLLERDHVRRSWEAVEETDLAEEVARLERANVLRPASVGTSTSNEPCEMMKKLRSTSPL